MSSLNQEWFPAKVPPKPSGYYAHIIMLRVTESYPLFQTDGELNTARVNAGVQDQNLITRLTIFKRKQTTPERLVGRELLRHYGFISPDVVDTSDKAEGEGQADGSAEAATEDDKPQRGKTKKIYDANNLPLDEYNVQFCPWTPDAICYGYAIGDTGSERSKVLSDTGYSITPYTDSHEAFTLNAPYESGTMSRRGVVTSRINEQDHVIPQVIFPSVLTVRDLPLPLFRYVLNNVIRTKRYGAQTTRTGRMENRLLGIVFCDGEIFSNLRFTQSIYDALMGKNAFNPPDPVNPDVASNVATGLIPGLIAQDGVVVKQQILGDDVKSFVQDLMKDATSETGAKMLLETAFAASKQYHDDWLVKVKKSGTRKGKGKK